MGKKLAPHLRTENNSPGVLNSELPESHTHIPAPHGKDYTGRSLSLIPHPPLRGKRGSPTHLPRGSAAARETRVRQPSNRKWAAETGALAPAPGPAPQPFLGPPLRGNVLPLRGVGAPSPRPWGRPAHSLERGTAERLPPTRRPPANWALGHNWLGVLG